MRRMPYSSMSLDSFAAVVPEFSSISIYIWYRRLLLKHRSNQRNNNAIVALV